MTNQEANKCLPAIGVLFIDNYEELGGGRNAEALSLVAQNIRNYLRDFNGVVQRYEIDRYTFVIEQEDLARIFQSKFSLLDQIREIATPNGRPFSLSIGIGLGATLPESNAFAYQSIDLAIGRGGDQAVVKRGDHFEFYGGKRQPDERYSRVKSRVFARALKQLMQQHKNILIMGHRMADYDALGSAMGLFSCAHAIGIQAHLVLDQAHTMIEGILGKAQNDLLFQGHIIDEPTALTLCDEQTLVLITDTQRARSLPAPYLLAHCGAVALIDHHRRGVDHIEPTLQYVQVSASSTCELVCEIIQYFSTDLKLRSIVASALLAGITVDTKHFSINTGARTFEAAAFLRRQGADPSIVKSLFQEDMQTYLARADIVRNARFVYPYIALSRCPTGTPDAPLVAAQAADALTAIRGIQAAFVLSHNPKEGVIHISARSIGDINVQVILESLGGGGHLNVAGVQLQRNDVSEVESLLIQSIENYLRKEAPEYLCENAEQLLKSRADIEPAQLEL